MGPKKPNSPCFFGISVDDGEYQASFEITNKCNLKCLHCCNNSAINKNSNMSKEEIIDLLVDLESINVKSIYITGGEPTLHPDFFEIVRYIISKKLSIVWATNAYNIYSHIGSIREIVNNSAGVFVSLDGLEATHDEFRGLNGSFVNTLRSIKMLSNNGFPVRISSIIWRNNVNELEEMTKLVKSLNAKHLHFSTLFKAGRAERADIFINDNQYHKVIDIIHNLIERYSDDEFTVSIRRDQVLDNNSERCFGGQKIMHINSQGQIFPCSWAEKCSLGQRYGYQWKKGNILDCLSVIRSFQNLVDLRIKHLGYSGCPAVAINLKSNELGDDPINNILKG